MYEYSIALMNYQLFWFEGAGEDPAAWKLVIFNNGQPTDESPYIGPDTPDDPTGTYTDGDEGTATVEEYAERPLIIYLPNHGFSPDDPVYCSWIDQYLYINDADQDSFVLKDSSGNIISYTEEVKTGFVRKYNASSGKTTIGGLAHLNGKSVYVTSGGEIVGYYKVSNGSITLPQTVFNYQVGLPYAMKITTMRLEIPSSGTVQSRIKRINETVVRHVKSKGGKAGQEYNDVEYLDNLNANFSSKAKDATVLTQGGYSEDGYTVVKSDEPYPFTVLATIISFSVDEQR